MKVKYPILFIALSLFFHTAHAGQINTQKFSIISADNVEIDTQDCIIALRNTFSQDELNNRDRYNCYGLKLQNVVIQLDSGEEVFVPEIVTSPMMELFGSVALNRQCSERIVNSMNRSFQGENLNPQERFRLPEFEIFGVEQGRVHAATAPNTIIGSRTLGRQSISYRHLGEDYNCHPQMNPPNLNIVESHYQEPVRDEGVIANTGRHLRGLGFEALRASENAANFVGTRVFGLGRDN